MVRRDFLRDFLWIHRRFPESHGKLDSPTGLSGWGWHDLDATSPWLNFHAGNFQLQIGCLLEKWKNTAGKGLHGGAERGSKASSHRLPTRAPDYDCWGARKVLFSLRLPLSPQQLLQQVPVPRSSELIPILITDMGLWTIGPKPRADFPTWHLRPSLLYKDANASF